MTMLVLRVLPVLALCVCVSATASGEQPATALAKHLPAEGLVAFWDFSEPDGRGRYPSRLGNRLVLREGAGPMERSAEGPFGSALRVREGQWLWIPRADIGALNIHGPDARVSVVAWIKRDRKTNAQCEFIAGVWNETTKTRQYGLFLGAMNSYHRIVAHLSDTGGPTPGHTHARLGAVGQTELDFDHWHTVAMTLDHEHARCYLDGKLDGPCERNPEPYSVGIFDGGAAGADFTAGANERVGVKAAPGRHDNFFVGWIGGLAIYDRALSPAEITGLPIAP